MKTLYSLSASALALATLLPANAQEAFSDTALQDVIMVTGQRMTTATDMCVSPDTAAGDAPDAAAMVARLPGAALIDNGGLSGQVQYRGMFGARINVRVDGQSFASGGPNLMDPPLHYAPLPLISQMVVDRGVSPVRKGPGLAGGVDAIFKKTDFADTSKLVLSHDLTAVARSADESTSVGGVAGAATDKLRFHVLGSLEEGGDLAYGDGDIRASSHERAVFGAGAGLKTGAHDIGLDLRRQNTGDTGNPPFPMDIRFIDTDFARLNYKGDFSAFDVESHVGWTSVSHAMTNFHLRPAPADMMRWRQTFAAADTVNAALAFIIPADSGKWRIGVDGESTDKNAVITNPNNAAFYVVSLPDIQSERYGAYLEWTGALGDVNAELGLRADTHEMTAGEAVTGPAVPMGATGLAAAFNASDRDWSETTTDLVARLWKPLDDNMTLRATLARKQRAPGYLEVFSWLPTGASGGLADGNTYVGDQDLEVETALIMEAGFDWISDRAHIRPTLFYRQVDDFIQGVDFDDTPGVINSPVEMVSSMNGDATPLIWANVDAEFFGIDMDAGLELSDHWRIDGVASWVRARRRDIDDNLYRASPPSLTASVTHQRTSWSATLETVMKAEQNHVSKTNSEEKTPGYALLNASADWHVRDGVNLSIGVDNLLDHTWRDHLAGYNRVMMSDVAVGERLPGAGRNAFIRLRVAK